MENLKEILILKKTHQLIKSDTGTCSKIAVTRTSQRPSTCELTTPMDLQFAANVEVFITLEKALQNIYHTAAFTAKERRIIEFIS